MSNKTSGTEQPATPLGAQATTSEANEVVAAPAPVETKQEAIAESPPAKSEKAAQNAPVEPAAAPVKAKARPVAAKKVPVTAKPAKEAKPVKEAKEKKPVVKKAKLVRDSFTFPESDYALIGDLKQRALSAGRDVKKSELLRAGLAALVALSEVELQKALDAVERIKTGRPAK